MFTSSIARPLSRSAKGFEPHEVPGLRLWHDAMRGASIKQSGGAIFQWEDLSGKGNHATKATSNQPVFAPAGLNGRPCLDFTSASSQRMDYAGGAAFLNLPVTIFAVCDIDTAAGHYIIAREDAGGANGSCILRTPGAGTTWQFVTHDGAGTKFSSTSVATDTPQVLTCIADGTDGTKPEVFKNGTSGGAGSAYSGYVNDPTADVGMGYRKHSGGGSYLDGQIAEIAVFDGVLSVGHRAGLEHYFSTKWGLGF